MPDYEFYCRRCKRSFSAWMSVREHDEKIAECPECHRSREVERRISFVNVVTTKKS